MKKSATAVLVVLVVALVALVGYLFYNQGQLQARMDQQWKESAALLAKEQKETAMFRQSYSNSIYEVTKRVKVEHHTEELTAEPFVITSAGTRIIRIHASNADVLKDATVSGRFTASGGTDSGIEVFIFDADNYINWNNGHKNKPVFDSGLKTVGTIDTRLDKAEEHFVVFSNKNASFFSRRVSTDLKLDYDTLAY